MKKDKLQLFLHIGQPKTGSSAIQGFLDINREYLATNYKILYPNFNNKDFVKGKQHNHAQFFMNFKKTDNFDGCLNTLENCLNYCQRKSIQKIVISNEGFEWYWWPKYMRNLIEHLKIEYKIILYLRRQDKWVESAWKQWGHKSDKYKSIHEYIKKSELDWSKYLSNWLQHFKPEDFIVRPYEEATIGADIVLDFIRILGFNNISDFVKPPEINLIANTGFNRDVVEVLNLCKSIVESEHDHRLLEFMYEMLPPKYRKEPMKNYGFLSPNERLEIINRYETSNNEIAKVFYGSESKKLFKEELPDINEKWEPYTGLTLEKFIPILIEILKHQDNDIKELKKSNNRLKDLFSSITNKNKLAKIVGYFSK